MKKVMSFIGCALFVAAMAVSCGHKNAEQAEEVLVDETTMQEAAPVECSASSDAEHQAMLDAATEAGLAKCNCYKTDAASVEACIKSIISEQYANYQDNEEFKAAMDEAYQNCIKEKASEAVKEGADKAVKAGAEALSNALNKK